MTPTPLDLEVGGESKWESWAADWERNERIKKACGFFPLSFSIQLEEEKEFLIQQKIGTLGEREMCHSISL